MDGSEKWLPKASVSFHIEEKKSQWHVYLTFINPDNPQEYLMHHMGTHRTESLAKLYGSIYIQQANKYHKQSNGISESFNSDLN